MRATQLLYGPLASGYDLPAGEGIDYDTATDEFLRLAGLPDLETTDGWATRLILATAPPHHETIGPAHFVVELPGYETAMSKLHLPRIEREVHERNIALYADAHGFGRLEIRFEGPLEFGNAGDTRPVARLELTDDGREATGYAIMRMEPEVVIDGVPFGRYEALVEDASRFVSLGPYPVEVGRAATRIAVDTSMLGDVECALQVTGGLAPAGGLSFEVSMHTPAGTRTRYTSRAAPPYRLGPFPEGRYTVSLRSPTFEATHPSNDDRRRTRRGGARGAGPHAPVNRALSILGRTVLAGIVLSSSLAKLLVEADPPHLHHEWLRVLWSSPARVTISTLELVIAGLLLSPWWILGARASLVACTAFALFIVLLRGLGIDPSTCGCFGAQELAGRAHAWLLVGMTVVAVGLVLPLETAIHDPPPS